MSGLPKINGQQKESYPFSRTHCYQIQMLLNYSLAGT